jgi:NhaP-type Na+/H+ or K+/H+ antiporter
MVAALLLLANPVHGIDTAVRRQADSLDAEALGTPDDATPAKVLGHGGTSRSDGRWDAIHWEEITKRREIAKKRQEIAKAEGQARVSNLAKVFDGLDYGLEGNTCVGIWEPWSECTTQCIQRRDFTVLEGRANDSSPRLKEECKKAEMPFDGEKDFRNCRDDHCPVEEMKLSGVNTHDIMHVKDFLMKSTYPIFSVGLASVLAVGIVNRLNLVWMPDAGVIILVSMASAMIVRFAVLKGVHYGDWADEILHFIVAPFMNLVLLPLSIFEGAYNTQRKNFWSQFPYSCVFAVFGTLASAFLLAFFIVQSGPGGANWHPIGTYREALCYSAFIADLDPVATLASFGKLKVDALLSTLVAGEATLNDPVAIVMFGILNGKSFDAANGGVAEPFFDGFLLLGVSMLLGVLGGFLLTLLQRLANLRGNDVIETLFLYASAYVLFAIGELTGYSGIIVDLFGGIVMGIYSRDNVDAGQRDFVLHALNTGARLCDMGIFMIVGFSAFTLRPWGEEDEFGDNPRAGEGIKFGLITIVLCLVVRVVVTALLVGLCNMHKKFTNQALIPTGTAVMIWHSQLRGGLTLMMALMIDPMWTANKPVMVDGTIVVCIGMCFLIGCTCPTMLSLCGVPMGVPQEDGTLSAKNLAKTWLGTVDRILRKGLCHQAPQEKDERRDSAFHHAFGAQRTANLMHHEPFVGELAESSDDEPRHAS